MMLADLLALRQTTTSLIVQDELECRGDVILAQLARQLRSRGGKCVVVCGERGADVFDGPVTSVPWLDATASADFVTRIAEEAEAQQACVFVDSFGSLAAFAGERAALKFVQRLLQRKGCSVYMCLHSNTVSAFCARELEHLCRTHVRIQAHSAALSHAGTAPHVGRQLQQQHVVVADTIHMRTGGSKPTTSRALVTINTLRNGQRAVSVQPLTAAPTLLDALEHTPAPITATATSPASTATTTTATTEAVSTRGQGATASVSMPSTTRTATAAAPPQPQQVSAGGGGGDDDPLTNLTFSLKLTEEEKAMRARTALPYAKTREEKQRALAGTGAIYYEPDDVDDFDDEDPDDDLDI
ncbi:hypothetical protein PTSG_00451 [Salpingoeca rosetta]|uniref:Elongator complex protein 5 n=1 Tax=Salpingoeca rosetta (strain ATCC 50818 / BSB-021) TaxID=946362 RepID=F2TWI6_SALR5|nr:uncharacterized protein PTSG_00451 [Salpingoeca rosetta]EGD72432.1 hypothetical protein PTSG_00451 [Salpingoeca rosetta]|eukprot:XP_004999001.1 hypothetical protein PTSG_00451 [Salpingoeca rosetta]